MGWLRRIATPVLVIVMGGCYETTELKLTVRTPPTDLRCADTADRVFAEQGFERIRTVVGTNMFYTPRTVASSSLALNWGIAVKIAEQSGENRGCAFEMQTLSRDPGCGIQCDLTPQRGEDYDRTLRDMAARLRQAFGPKSE